MASGARKRILLVDDDQTHLRAVREILELEGYEVHTNSQSMGTTRMVMGLEPDLILLDVNMPNLTGDRLAAILKRNEIAAHIPVVFYSGNEESVLREMAARCGASGYIRKGDPAVLRARVAALLGSPVRS